MPSWNINPAFYTPLSIIIAGIIIAGAIVGVGHVPGSSAAVPSTNTGTTATVDSSQVSSAGNPTLGSDSAPLTIAYWFDYQCPFCKQNEATVMPSIIKDYVDTGKVRIVFKDFSFLGPDSDTLGHAGRAVWQVAPQKFSAWHTAVYADQGEENTGWATLAEIQKITASVLTPSETAQVMQLMQSDKAKYQAAMDADKQEGEQDGVQGTPAMLIGTQMIAGAEPYATVKAAIDQELAKK